MKNKTQIIASIKSWNIIFTSFFKVSDYVIPIGNFLLWRIPSLDLYFPAVLTVCCKNKESKQKGLI